MDVTLTENDRRCTDLGIGASPTLSIIGPAHDPAIQSPRRNAMSTDAPTASDHDILIEKKIHEAIQFE